MKISFLGDSITEGCGASEYGKGFVEVLGKKLGVEVRNYGIGGTRIAKNKTLSAYHGWDMYFSSRFDFIDEDSDFLFVFGGTNDYGHGDALMGDIKDETDLTFYGALNNLIGKCVKQFGKDKICFILPLRRYGDETKNANGYVLKDYVNALKTVLKEKCIDFIDLYNNGLPLPTTDTGDEWTVDGLHPNDKGHEFLAETLIEYLKNKKVI